MSGAFISSWLRMMFASALKRREIASRDWLIKHNTSQITNGNGRNGGANQAKRQALKLKRRKAHRRNCR